MRGDCSRSRLLDPVASSQDEAQPGGKGTGAARRTRHIQRSGRLILTRGLGTEVVGFGRASGTIPHCDGKSIPVRTSLVRARPCPLPVFAGGVWQVGHSVLGTYGPTEPRLLLKLLEEDPRGRHHTIAICKQPQTENLTYQSLKTQFDDGIAVTFRLRDFATMHLAGVLGIWALGHLGHLQRIRRSWQQG